MATHLKQKFQKKLFFFNDLPLTLPPLKRINFFGGFPNPIQELLVANKARSEVEFRQRMAERISTPSSTDKTVKL